MRVLGQCGYMPYRQVGGELETQRLSQCDSRDGQAKPRLIGHSLFDHPTPHLIPTHLSRSSTVLVSTFSLKRLPFERLSKLSCRLLRPVASLEIDSFDLSGVDGGGVGLGFGFLVSTGK